MAEAAGIHGLSSDELLRLLRAIARPDFADPVSRSALVLAKFGHLEGELDVLVGHGKRAALAIVSAILRERERSPGLRAEAAWSGPPPTGHGTRVPYELLVELIATAEKSLWFIGVELERDARLLRSLHAAQRGRELRAVVVLARQEPELARLTEALFGAFRPWPELYAPDPERLRGALPLSLLSDGKRGLLLAGTAPDVDGPDWDLSAGIHLDASPAIGALIAQWQALIDSGVLVPLMAADAASA